MEMGKSEKNKPGLKGHTHGDMEVLDRILDLLYDSRWHRLDEIKAEFSLPENVVYAFIHFLEGQAFIELDKEKNAVKINPLGVKFIELPLPV